MDESALFFVLIIGLVAMVIIPAFGSQFIGEEHQHTGHINNVEYAQGGWGTPSITTVFFTDKTLNFNSNEDININTNATITWFESPFNGYKQFRNI